MKESKKQIKAQVINEVQKQFAKKLTDMETSLNYQKTYVKELEDENKVLRTENGQLKEENQTLKLKVEQYNEWIERLQDFCNLPENERKQAFESYTDSMKAKASKDKSITHLMDMIDHFSSLFIN